MSVNPENAGGHSRLKDLENFGSNPGALKAKIHIAAEVSKRPALVVVLHGCTQTAGGYDRGSGWSTLADEHGFLLLFPEQQRANNPNLCFNWFSSADNQRERGEALSIRQMISAMVETHDVDPSRIFVTGLSAGGAMTSIMLACYPEVFAGGAIIAGLPHGSASNVQQALQAMRDPGTISAKALGDRVREASNHNGAWPSISIWHGSADPTVSVTNADAILAQWLCVHELGNAPDRTQDIAGHRYRMWSAASGRPLIEDYRIANMGHGTPLATTGAQACGVAMPHMLEAGISSTRRIAASWGLLGEVKKDASTHPFTHTQAEPSTLPARRISRLEPMSATPSHAGAPAKAGVEKVIHDALRAAGLMRST
ncbi:extracellular catalytic domain type 1 short-chain-length polyhydroxyalkanoate depolymerase [Sphingobium sp. YR768]|uniref:extracellular catalytic domain type 1 short-chain-length polyhydroxyalkanoate depolymerase n=1 Tax=Sphingobium sp. YR768 TaxID=1884365 RepID=UPI00210DCBC9|nr:PHB depolymerase family esterase [Sphingobium sp. YR768]